MLCLAILEPEAKGKYIPPCIPFNVFLICVFIYCRIVIFIFTYFLKFLIIVDLQYSVSLRRASQVAQC